MRIYNHKLRLGLKSEYVAGKYLKKRGWDLLERRLYVGRKEIDWLVFDNSTREYVAVEVRSRVARIEDFEEPLMDEKKFKRLFSALSTYFCHKLPQGNFRIDLVEVFWHKKWSGLKAKIQHTENFKPRPRSRW